MLAAPALLLSACAASDDGDASAAVTGVPMSPTATESLEQTIAADTTPFDVTAPRREMLPEEVRCQYERAGSAARPVVPPQESPVSARGTVSTRLELRDGALLLTLDRAKSPCAVNSFLSLAEQRYFDSTICHRLTTRGVFTLHCGDPTGTGIGGPGYMFSEEFPGDEIAAEGGSREVPTTYPRGTVAMKGQDPGKNGSQFLIVYDDSPLPPVYTVIGTVDDGLELVDEIASEGTTPEHQGAPRHTVQIMGVVIE